MLSVFDIHPLIKQRESPVADTSCSASLILQVFQWYNARLTVAYSAINAQWQTRLGLYYCVFITQKICGYEKCSYLCVRNTQ